MIIVSLISERQTFLSNDGMGLAYKTLWIQNSNHFGQICRLELDTDEVAQNLQFERAASGINFAIVISHVEPGSQCEKVNF